MAGGSRAAQRREKRKAKANGAAVPVVAEPAAKCARVADAAAEPAASVAPAASVVPAANVEPVADSEGAASGWREWQIPAPTPDDDDGLFEALQIAVEQAGSIHGRKYRYGALLLAGDDHVPLKSGSNKKPFLRDNIHAEMCVLKGCTRPRGKDMFIARLAPTAPATEDAAAGASAAPKPRRKILNARPCERCEAKMVRTGIRRCYFTINAASVGVLEYNPDD